MFIDAIPGGKGEVQVASKSDPNDWLRTGIISELSRRGLKYRDRSSRGPASTSYAQDSEIVREELLKALHSTIPNPKYAQKLELGRVAAHCLATYLLRSKKFDLGLKIMLNNVGKTFEAIDALFPGYLQAGLLGSVLEAR